MKETISLTYNCSKLNASLPTYHYLTNIEKEIQNNINMLNRGVAAMPTNSRDFVNSFDFLNVKKLRKEKRK